MILLCPATAAVMAEEQGIMPVITSLDVSRVMYANSVSPGKTSLQPRYFFLIHVCECIVALRGPAPSFKRRSAAEQSRAVKFLSLAEF